MSGSPRGSLFAVLKVLLVAEVADDAVTWFGRCREWLVAGRMTGWSAPVTA